MYRASLVLLLVAVFAICVGPSTAWASQADELFQQALAAERSGDVAQHDRLLKQTLQADPEHQLARWHSGQVLHNGQWQSPEQIERRVANDPRWQEYRQRVAEGTDTREAHARLARWCRTEGLQLEEQWHWYNVLRHDAKNREALGALKLRPYQGSYLTVEQIAEVQEADKLAKDNFKQYSEVLNKALRDAERGDSTERMAARKRIAGLTDPAAIPAIEEVVLFDTQNERRIVAKYGSEKGEKLLQQMQQAALTALAEMPDHEATLALLNVALYASNEQIRSEASSSLKYREVTAYVPMLMAQLAAPIELTIGVHTLPNGKISVLKDFYENGPQGQHRHTAAANFLTQFIRKETFNPPFPATRGMPRGAKITGVWTNHLRDIHNASRDIAITESRVATENALREENNRRIHDVLAIVFDKKADDPVVWWNLWKDHNELYIPETIYETEERIDNTTQYVQTIQNFQYGRTMSCFVAGTPVWTQMGMVPIEQIRVGDLVLSQDPHTGELNYRPVVDTTVRPPSGTIKLDIDNNTIVTTRGHRFWTADKGWQMAKFLKGGQLLVTANGLAELQTATTGADVEAFNLEVGEFHTYFVGESRILVHDNTCPRPTTNRIPGVAAEVRNNNRLTAAH